ncbi:MAG: enoyl-CoA hydratase/carnithine racemase [Candidatus Pseudothioglobus sp.]|jgi:enoyl-CoA hydratase/carnithine racemase
MECKMPDNKLVLVDRHDGWAEVRLNRPERRNSIIAPLSVALKKALLELENDDTVSCVVLRGEGGYFCSGVDLKALQADPPPPWRNQQFSSWRDLHLLMYQYPKPIVGAFEKYGINAGAALALACDILIAGETAFLQIGEIQQGAGMPMNAAWLKLKTTEQVAARLAFFGDRVLGPELVRLGLAAECVADNVVVDRCQEIAKRMAGFPLGASMTVKQSIIDQRGITDIEAFFSDGGGSATLLSADKVS